jgi:hypothetical protein
MSKRGLMSEEAPPGGGVVLGAAQGLAGAFASGRLNDDPPS